MPITQSEFLQMGSSPGGISLNLTSADLAAGSVGTSELAAGAVTFAKQATFISSVQTGTGSSQSIAHGLGATPAHVLVAFTGTTASQAVTEGTHTGTNVVVTVTTGATFKVIAFA